MINLLLFSLMPLGAAIALTIIWPKTYHKARVILTLITIALLAAISLYWIWKPIDFSISISEKINYYEFKGSAVDDSIAVVLGDLYNRYQAGLTAGHRKEDLAELRYQELCIEDSLIKYNVLLADSLRGTDADEDRLRKDSLTFIQHQ
jgi:hypothetical protein